MVGALSLNEVVACVNISGSVDSLTFEAFIIRKLIPKLWKGACVVMDNAKIHLGKMIGQEIEKVGAKLIYLSPYSPDFSPIENFWSKVKAILKKISPRTNHDLVEAIDLAMKEVTPKNIHNWFTHCCYCTS